MAFPDDYFTMFKRYSPTLPPLDRFRYVGTTQDDPYANLVYVGDMNGHLRATRGERRFLVIQFEKEHDAWKYAVVIDPPVEIVPDWERKLADGPLDFPQSRPFKAERIDPRP